MNNNFTSVPNQRNITIHKINSKPKQYSVVNLKANKKAMKELSYSAYMLYMYFCINANDFSFWLSMKYVCKNTGFSRSTYYSAMRELQEKGYLYPEEKTFLEFYEDPNLRTDILKNSETNDEKTNSKYQKATEKIKKQKNKGTLIISESDSRAHPQDAPSPATISTNNKNSLFF